MIYVLFKFFPDDTYLSWKGFIIKPQFAKHYISEIEFCVIMTTFKRLRPNIFNHKILIAGLNSVTSALLLLGGPSLLTKVQDIKVFYLMASLKIATMLTSFCNSVIPLWQLNGLGKGSLTAPGIRWQKVFTDLEVLCHIRAATPPLTLGNLRVKTSVTHR